MRTKEDARVTRTKTKLFDSFKELLSEKTFEEITINEICIRSGIRRATFYKHFSDKYDFLAGLTRQLRQDFDEKIWKNESWSSRHLSDYYIEYMKAIVAYLDKNREIVKMIFDSNMTSSLVEVIVEENYKRTKEKLEGDIKNGLAVVASSDTAAIYLAGGISNALIKWFKCGMEIPKEQFISEIGALVSAIFVK